MDINTRNPSGELTPRPVPVPPGACCRVCFLPATWALEQMATFTLRADGMRHVTWVTDAWCAKHGPPQR